MQINRRVALLACATAVVVSVIPAYAAQKTKSTQGPKAKTTTTVQGPKTKTTSAGTTTKASGHGPKTKATTTATSTTPGSTDSKKTVTSTSTTFTPEADNAVAVQLASKTKLIEKVKGILGEDVNLNMATKDFRNLGQFIAAVNVSNNNPNDIDFSKLKALMTGTDLEGNASTSSTKMSLGQAIHELSSGLDAEAEAAKATTQANKDTSGK